MAGELEIRVIGTAPGLKAFFDSTSRQADDFVRRSNATYSQYYKDLLGIKQFPVFDSRGVPQRDAAGNLLRQGSLIKRIKAEYDQLENSIKTTALTGLELSTGEFIPIAKTQQWLGEEKLVTAEMQKQAMLLAEQGDIRGRAVAQGEQLRRAYRADQNAAYAARRTTVDPLRQSLFDAQTERMTLTEAIRDRRAWRAGGMVPGFQQASFDNATNQMVRDRNALMGRELNLRRQITAAESAHNATISARTALYEAERGALGRTTAASMAANKAELAASKQREAAARVAPPTVPQGYQQLQQLSPQLLRELQKGGLGVGTGPLGDVLRNQQMANFNAPVYDMVRGVTRLSGEFVNNKGILTQWSAEIDKSGRMITRFGGNLRGFSRVFEQIGRDFQKVIEWTVATTVIFGSMRAAMAGLDIIKTLDADLTRFTVTAGLSAKQTQLFYGELFKVAQLTATPIEELVKAADDLALAVRRPGQSTKELTNDINTLAQAIGIYTNLTGQDTVSATDQLVAVMKQLGYTASEVYTILNKVTASAGGQSGAIADITKGLAVMAEAGKQAGLEVDQQIAVIKTLSQVTSKSPAEVATAFKNLVGALENPAAIKALSKLNIALISEGNDIIGIYTEIARKIQTGEIAGTEVSGLLRAISGGPRRAPDAAALLSNINTVLKETKVSANATNEAFLANAQIMTTLNAKITQFQNTLKDKTFQQFGEVFKDLATTGIGAVTQLLDIFSKVPPVVITAAIQATILAAAFKLLLKLLIPIGSGIVGISRALLGFSAASTAAAAAEGQLTLGLIATNQQLTIRQRLMGGIGGKKGLAAGAAGFVSGAALSAAGGAEPQQILGGGLQGLGLALMMVPEGTVTKVVGGVALIAGTLLQLINTQEKVQESSAETAQALLEAYSNASGAADSIHALETDQKTLIKTMDDLEKKKAAQGKAWTADDQATLNDTYRQYADNILASADAHKQLNDAIEQFGELEKSLPGITQWASRLRGILANPEGIIPEEFLKQLEQYQTMVLEKTFPELQKGRGDLQQVKIGTGVIPQTGEGPFGNKVTIPTPATITPVYGGAPITTPAGFQSMDMSQLSGANIGKLFSKNAEGVLKFDAVMQLTRENIDLVNTAIGQLGDTAEAADMKKAFDQWTQGADSITDASNALEYYQQANEALRVFRPNVAAQLDEFFPLIDEFITSGLSNLDAEQYSEILNQVMEQVFTSLKFGTLIPNDKLREMAEGLALGTGRLNGLTAGTERYEQIVNDIATALFGWKSPIDAASGAMRELTDESLQLLQNVDQVVAGALGTLAQKSLDAAQQLANKEISQADYEKEIAQINDMAIAIQTLGQKFNEAATTGGQDFIDAFNNVKASLSGIPGLQDAAVLSADQFIQRMFDVAMSARLSGQGLTDFMNRVYAVFQAMQTIAKIRATMKIYADLDTTAFVAKLRQMAKALRASGGVFAGNDMLAGWYEYQANQLSKAANVVSGFKMPAPARAGGGGGGGGSSRQGKDYGELDLPEELSDLPNRDSLIAQAIRNARKLQRKIPGASREARNDVVTILDGMKKLETVRGVREDLLRRALEDLANIEKKRLEFETKADMIRRIRIGSGDWSAIANVPVNTKTGVSLGGAEGPVNITLNLNGTVLTPAQFADFANLIAAALKRQLAK